METEFDKILKSLGLYEVAMSPTIEDTINLLKEKGYKEKINEAQNDTKN